jgi:hypothetical protein
MQIKSNVRMLCSRFQTMLRRRKQEKPMPQISAPFNLKSEPVSLPGVSEDELSILREKAAASRIGIAETMPLSHSKRTRSRSPIISTPTTPATF